MPLPHVLGDRSKVEICMVGDSDPCAALVTCRIAALDARNLRPHFGSMFYRPAQPDAPRAGLLNALVLPRPIGWISTLNSAGQANLAPFSFFNAVAYTPPQVMSPPGSCAGRSTPARSARRTALMSSCMPVWPSRRRRPSSRRASRRAQSTLNAFSRGLSRSIRPRRPRRPARSSAGSLGLTLANSCS